MNDFKILGLYKGVPKKLKNSSLISSIASRTETRELLEVDTDQIKGDKVHDLKHHGGQDRVVHFYPSEHYEFWKETYPDNKDVFYPSSIGENISSIGFIEKEVCIGDIYKIGEVVLQVTEPRNPCGFIDQNYGIKLMHKKIANLAKCGWMCRVLNPGIIHKDDSINLIEKGDLRYSIYEVIVRAKVNPELDFMNELIKLESLSARYRANIKRKIEQKKAP
jgi:MOSC domain-containing protein YiiM